MPNGILILISVLCFSANAILTRTFQVKLQKRSHSINLYQALFTLTASAAYFVLSFCQNLKFSAHIILPSILFGICFAGAVLFSAKCSELGFMSISSVITNLSLILPVMFSWIVTKDIITPNGVIGLILIIITFLMSAASAGEGENKNLKRWILFIIIAFVCNGSSAIVQKQYKASFGEQDLMLFMGFSYLTAAFIFFITFFKRNKGCSTKITKQVTSFPYLILLAVISGLGSFGGNGILGFLCDKVNGGILYPCINGGLSVAAAISSFAIFKEKLSFKKTLAVIIGISAIVILNM